MHAVRHGNRYGAINVLLFRKTFLGLFVVVSLSVRGHTEPANRQMTIR